MPALSRKRSATEINSFQAVREALGERIIYVPIPAITATISILACFFDTPKKVLAMAYVPLAQVAFHASNFYTIGLKDQTAAADIISAAGTAILNNAANFEAFAQHVHTVSSPGKVAGGTVLTVEFTKNASAANLPAGMVAILVQEE